LKSDGCWESAIRQPFVSLFESLMEASPEGWGGEKINEKGCSHSSTVKKHIHYFPSVVII
jgi:hypothetical protein